MRVRFDRIWLTFACALLLILLAAYSIFAVVFGLAAGGHHAWIFWPTIVLFILFSAWAARQARRLMRRGRDLRVSRSDA